MKQIEVQILGQGYLLGCPEGGESRLRDAAERVNAAMTRIRDAGKIRARDRIAVLAALNLAFDATERPATPADTGVAGVAGDAAADGTRWTHLLQRLDDALAEDGRLL
ncbi:cell division protein ZapA [Xylophilus sp. GOD-11R]|uniref:cell division protein ZapA n=1 Tax=Xylophilus sp. GOD-11R TaxID=3089814 RepID=UPI00298CD387|nr:cell division protein ZapA [Xylophilus sp. GOD-11R]WPB58552.1 cell division protein ZapA [Xylophilus sp. GOD-11R]